MGEHYVGTIALRAFVLILLAEMGDKTQLMSMALAARYQRPGWVFVGAVAALAIVTLIGVVVGDALTRIIPARRLHQVAGLVFIGIGLLMLLRKA